LPSGCWLSTATRTISNGPVLALPTSVQDDMFDSYWLRED
jgi:hypothetical protein